jgi:hypothetical protein
MGVQEDSNTSVSNSYATINCFQILEQKHDTRTKQYVLYCEWMNNRTE